MSSISIVYRSQIDEGDIELGKEVYSDISIAQLPDDPVDKKIFINKTFTGQQYNSWKVISIDIVHDESKSQTDCCIDLEPVRYKSTSIAATHSANGSKLVRGRLLECDFGFFSQDVVAGQNNARNIDNFNGKLPYEMIKRRLVVVLSHKEDPALVVPISKSSKGKNKKTVVPVTSLPKDLVSYKETKCYAKAGAISLVSGHRLFPLRYEAENRKFYDNRVEKKLSNDDVTSIKKAVFTGIGGNNILNQIEEEKVSELESQIANRKS